MQNAKLKNFDKKVVTTKNKFRKRRLRWNSNVYVTFICYIGSFRCEYGDIVAARLEHVHAPYRRHGRSQSVEGCK
jgi:hypothetical protein